MSKKINLFLNFFLLSILTVSLSFAGEKEKTEITGDRMEIRKSGEKTIFKGNAKIARGSNTITSDKMIYYKNTSQVEAHGNVNFLVKNKDGSSIRAASQKAIYNTDDNSGKLWDGNPVIEYDLENSTDTLYLYADKITLKKSFESALALDNVKIVSSSGTIASDNALLNKNNSTLFMHKDKNKPQVNIWQDDKQAEFKADEISLLYNDKTIQMNNNVEGKIIMNSLGEIK